ncbi:hypothetical protein B0H10DRAFT_1939299 [Mycena sp. CBHHK59/15]|nr:hypothetical protein B0H10DRAFT_1939299 [Mycena sp. CBHHK59/15]
MLPHRIQNPHHLCFKIRQATDQSKCEELMVGYTSWAWANDMDTSIVENPDVALSVQLWPVHLPASKGHDILILEACNKIVGAFTLVRKWVEPALLSKIIDFMFAKESDSCLKKAQKGREVDGSHQGLDSPQKLGEVVWKPQRWEEVVGRGSWWRVKSLPAVPARQQQQRHAKSTATLGLLPLQEEEQVKASTSGTVFGWWLVKTGLLGLGNKPQAADFRQRVWGVVGIRVEGSDQAEGASRAGETSIWWAAAIQHRRCSPPISPHARDGECVTESPGDTACTHRIQQISIPRVGEYARCTDSAGSGISARNMLPPMAPRSGDREHITEGGGETVHIHRIRGKGGGRPEVVWIWWAAGFRCEMRSLRWRRVLATANMSWRALRTNFVHPPCRSKGCFLHRGNADLASFPRTCHVNGLTGIVSIDLGYLICWMPGMCAGDARGL